VMADPEAVFRAFSYATVDAFLVRSHILCDLTIRTAMRISHIALPCLVRPRALCGAPTREQHYEKQETQTRQCSLWISCHRIPPDASMGPRHSFCSLALKHSC
jgi:hypothetical protein